MNIPSIKKHTFALILAGSALLTILFLNRETIFLGSLGNIILLITLIVAGFFIISRTRNIAKNKSAWVAKNNNLPDHLGEMLHRAILETSTDSFVATNLTGRIIFCNQQTVTLYGYDSADELIGKSLFSLFPKKEIIRAAKFLQMTRKGDMIKNVEFTLLKKDSAPFLAELSASLIKNEAGIPIAFMATVRDITERRWVEEQIRESEARYRIVADNTFDWEFWQAPNERFIYTSPSCKRITGWDAVDFIKNPELAMDIIHEDDKLQFESHMHEAKENKTSGEIEFRILRADGQERWISHICQPVIDDHGLYMGTRGSNRDITERKHAEDELQLVNEKLRLQLAEIEELQIILRKQALHDPLTGLYNRRYMEDGLRKELARASREGYQICIALLDMDNLKVFNDSFGHAIGDKALILLSEKLRELTRIDDILCRYGGDEFLIVLHKTNMANGFKRVEQWRKIMEEMRIPDQGHKLQITFTAGISTFPAHGKTLEEIIKVADDALYAAKKKGKNIVTTPN